jgi:hypothetical protein
MFSKRRSNFNRSTKKEDIAPLLEAIWAQHQQGEGGRQIDTSQKRRNAFEDRYLIKYMDRINSDIADVLSEQTVRDWRTIERRLIFMGCFLNRDSRIALSGLKKPILCFLRSIEVQDKQGFKKARSPGTFITDHAGMVELASTIANRMTTILQPPVWNHVSTLYVTSPNEGFQIPQSPMTSMPVYFTFLYRKQKDVSADVSFRTYFSNDLTWQQVISASDYKDASKQWAEDGKADFNVDAIHALLGSISTANNMLVNIGGGPIITHLGLVSPSEDPFILFVFIIATVISSHFAKEFLFFKTRAAYVLEVVHNKEDVQGALERAKQIWAGRAVAAIPKPPPPVKPKKTTPKKTEKKKTPVKKKTVSKKKTVQKSEKSSDSSTSHSEETCTKESKLDKDQWEHEPSARMKKTPVKAFAQHKATSSKGVQRSLSERFEALLHGPEKQNPGGSHPSSTESSPTGLGKSGPDKV